MKKFLIPITAALAAMASFTSCDDATDCGCECSRPVISKIETIDGETSAVVSVDLANDSIDAGSTVIVTGKNLGNVTAVTIEGKDAGLKPAFRTDNTLVFTLPSVAKSTKAVFYTKSCPSGYTMDLFNVRVGAPEIFMAYNEFVPEGGLLKLKGKNFVGDQIYVGFVSTDGQINWVNVPAYGAGVEGGAGIKDEDGTELWVNVPAGVAESNPLYVWNFIANKQSVSKIIFRDTRNMLADFENHLEYNFHSGSVTKNDADGTYNVYSYTGFGADGVQSVPGNYTNAASGINQFGIITPEDWTAISYIATGDNETDDQKTVFANVIDDARANYANYCVKFELFVPEDYALDGAALTIGFSGNQTAMSAPREYAAWFCPSQVSWTTTSTPWTVSSAKSFYTDGWMTVTIPMSEFIWNISMMNPTTSAQNYVNKTYSEIPETDASKIYGDGGTSGDPSAHLSYVQHAISAGTDLADEDGEFFSGLFMIYSNDDAIKSDDSFLFAIDNVRLVKYDGNGAIYPKLNFGVPSQHYSSAPRTSAYLN